MAAKKKVTKPAKEMTKAEKLAKYTESLKETIEAPPSPKKQGSVKLNAGKKKLVRK